MKKYEIDEETKIGFIRKYDEGYSIRKIVNESTYSFNVIYKIIKSYESEKQIILNYPQKEGYNMVAVCKKTKKEIFDYKNTSGAIAIHVFNLYPEEKLKSKFVRKAKEYETGKFWYDEYFDFDYSRAANVRTCSISGTRNDGRQSYFIWEWELSDNKKFIQTTITYDAYDYGAGIFRQNIKPSWKIIKLKANDMILTTTYFSKEYLIELTADK